MTKPLPTPRAWIQWHREANDIAADKPIDDDMVAMMLRDYAADATSRARIERVERGLLASIEAYRADLHALAGKASTAAYALRDALIKAQSE